VSKKSSKTTEQEEHVKSKNKLSSKAVEIKSTTVLNVEKPSKTMEVEDVRESESLALTKRFSTDEGADSTPMHNVSTRTVVTAVVHRENVNSSTSSEEGISEKANEQSPTSSTQDTETVADAGHQPIEEGVSGKGIRGKEDRKKEDKRVEEHKRKGYHKREDAKEEYKRKHEHEDPKVKEQHQRKGEHEEHQRKGDHEGHQRKGEHEKHHRRGDYEGHGRKAEQEEHLKVVEEEHKEKDENKAKTDKTENGAEVHQTDGKTQNEEASQDSSALTESMEAQEEGGEIAKVEESSDAQAHVEEQDGVVKEELEEPAEDTGFSEAVDSSSRTTAQIGDQGVDKNVASKDQQASKKITPQEEKRLNRTGEASRVNRYGAVNLRKEKTNNVSQVRKTVTSKSSYSVMSKRTVGKNGSRKEPPAFTIDVDDELSEKSPNDQLVDSGLEHSPRRDIDKGENT